MESFDVSHLSRVSHQTSIQRHRPLRVAGADPNGENSAPKVHHTDGVRDTGAGALCADNLPRNAIELAAARDALLIG
jgi:hypothetical protein